MRLLTRIGAIMLLVAVVACGGSSTPANRAPSASFTFNPPTPEVSDTITLDASASSDPDGDTLSYTWALEAPADSQATLSSLDGSTSTLTADVAGDYTLTLVVDDGEFDDTAVQIVSVSAQTAFRLDQKLLPQDAVAGGGFGRSVALDGDTIAVGAANVSSPGGDTDRDGVVYVFVRRGEQWQQQAMLSAAGTDQSLFGAAVALSGDTLVVGAPTGDGPRSTSGIAFVFTRQSGTWSAPQQIVGTGSGQFDRFGNSVAIDGNTILVGAPSATVSGAVAAGAVYVFGRSDAQWQQQARLVTSNPTELDQFGTSLALDNDTFVSGAPSVIVDPEDGEPSAGTAYVFTRTADVWRVQATLRLSDSGDNNRFGRAVALNGDTLAASAPGTGRVYLYTRGGSDWTLQDDVATGDTTSPGGAFSLSGDTLAAGSLVEDQVYLFERQAGQWLEQNRLTPGSATSSYFGRALALQNGTLVVGAQLDDDVAGNAGAAYVYREGPITTSLPPVARTPSDRAQ